ncbi:class I SAM-dependent methyltransferase [Uliginosibacterium sp. 31-16]|uniref:class I SAM-dependent methyltransferase n=1 Tax=Uliginosibacterium sp. 31-16 TaxID=3068315 RepID=UPI00273F5DF1|nr:class I SAM-dependent methyltransferase [Uliginosibacterium sp. 31-16]MDP5238448.1 class I SAM-dependent methyltransferase [Uliginosibacterium sp. 31-16]
MNTTPLNWLNDTDFEIGGYVMALDYAHGGSKVLSNDSRFLMMKAKNFLGHYTSLVPEECRKILELGVYQGGSFVFLDQLLKPDRISAIELSTNPIPALDKYISDNSDRARLYYGTSQDDVEQLREIVGRDFDGHLDLVVDDASHFYEQTKTSFKTLFPLVRPGGMYIIEDWCWAFQDDFQDPANGWYSVPSPANLIIDLMEDMTRSGLILDIQVTRELLKIRRSNLTEGEVMATTARRGRTYNLL